MRVQVCRVLYRLSYEKRYVGFCTGCRTSTGLQGFVHVIVRKKVCRVLYRLSYKHRFVGFCTCYCTKNRFVGFCTGCRTKIGL